MMKMDFITDILSEIDNAESITMESMINVFDSMLNEYDKMLNHQTCYVEGFVQEAAKKESIMDQATGAGKNENIIVKVMAFIPRLLIAVIKKIASIFTKDKEAEIKAAPGKLETTISNASEDQLNKADEKLDKATDGVIRVHPKRKCFIVRGFTHVKNIFLLATSFPDLFRLIKSAFQKKTFSWSRLGSDISNFYKNKGEIAKLMTEGKSSTEIVSQLKNYAGDEVATKDMTEILNIFAKSGFAISALASEAELLNNKIAVERDKKGLDPTEAMKAEEVAKTISKTTGILAVAANFFKGITGIVGFFDRLSDNKKAAEEAKETHRKAMNDQFRRFTESEEGQDYAKYSSYEECKKALSGKIIKNTPAWKQFENAFEKWKTSDDASAAVLSEDPSGTLKPKGQKPIKGKVVKDKKSKSRKGESESKDTDNDIPDTIDVDEDGKTYAMITDSKAPADWGTGDFYVKKPDGSYFKVAFRKEHGDWKPEYVANNYYRKN